MNNLIVFVEGKHDVLFINNILLKYFNVSKNWIPITYQQKSKKIKIKNVNSVIKRGHDYIFLSDLDSHTYTGVNDRKKSRIKEFRKEGYDDLNPEKMFIVIEEIESWYISGVKNNEFDNITIPDDTTSFTKEQMDEMISNSKFSSKRDFLMEISKVFNPDLAIQRNSSFKYFVEKLGLTIHENYKNIS